MSDATRGEEDPTRSSGSRLPSSNKHPLVSSLLWLWRRFSVQDASEHADGEEKTNNAGSGSPISAGSSNSSNGSRLGALWTEEYGSHLDVYAECFEELKKADAEPSLTRLVTKTGGSSPFHTPSPAWGWFVSMTPPNDSSNSRVFKATPPRTLHALTSAKLASHPPPAPAPASAAPASTSSV